MGGMAVGVGTPLLVVGGSYAGYKAAASLVNKYGGK